MPTFDTLLVFAAAAVLLNISPGPSNFYVMSRSLAQGLRGGAVAAIGLALGSLFHVVAAAFGLAAVFHYFPAAYTAIKLLGAVYLIYLGIRMLRGRDGRALPSVQREHRPHGRILGESVLVELLNPKTALFFIAFLPQFVDVSRAPPGPQILVLGLIVTLSAIPCDLLVALVSASAARTMSKGTRWARVRAYVPGTLLIGLGLYVAYSERPE